MSKGRQLSRYVPLITRDRANLSCAARRHVTMVYQRWTRKRPPPQRSVPRSLRIAQRGCLPAIYPHNRVHVAGHGKARRRGERFLCQVSHRLPRRPYGPTEASARHKPEREHEAGYASVSAVQTSCRLTVQRSLSSAAVLMRRRAIPLTPPASGGPHPRPQLQV